MNHDIKHPFCYLCSQANKETEKKTLVLAVQKRLGETNLAVRVLPIHGSRKCIRLNGPISFMDFFWQNGLGEDINFARLQILAK